MDRNLNENSSSLQPTPAPQIMEEHFSKSINGDANVIEKRKRESNSHLPRKRTKILYSEPVREPSSSKQDMSPKSENLTSPLTSLPVEVLQIIFTYLDHFSLTQLRETCTFFRRLCNDFALRNNIDFLFNSASNDDLTYYVSSREIQFSIDNSSSAFTSLPEEILRIIFSLLDHHTLTQLKETCHVFHRLCSDFTLWNKVHFMLKPATPPDILYIAKSVHEGTTSCRIQGSPDATDTSNHIVELLDKLKRNCPNLDDLTFLGQYFESRQVLICNFPTTLTSLSLSHSLFVNLPADVSYFRGISILIPNLRRLDLSGCTWFEPHSLMAISKCQFLEELFLNDCSQMKDCLAYCGLATRGGFKKLKTIDLRRCFLSNSELLCFSSLPTLTHIYLEVPPGYHGVLDTSFLVVSIVFRRYNPNVQGLSKIEKFVIRNFPNISLSLLLILTCPNNTPSLKYLDITGSGLCEESIDDIRRRRPALTLVSESNEDDS